MASKDYGDVFDFSDMTDEEIRDVVVEQLREYPNVDADWIDVDVRNGFVTLSGRVGTGGEVQVAAQVLDDVLGIDDYSNELVVDELHRSQSPEAADRAVTQEAKVEDQLGEEDPDQSDTADHLTEDLESQSYGTHDLETSIQEGAPYVPPDRPVPDGYNSGENH